MSRRNRVTPTGEIVAIGLRGAWTGNRGILHDGDRLARTHAGDLWIICALDFRDRWRPQWVPYHYTHLYFHDEAVAFAAGHRPCAECRRDSYLAFRDAFPADTIPGARDLNRQLHAERLIGGTSRRRRHPVPWTDVPDGAFVWLEQSPWLVLCGRLVGWTSAGYTGVRDRPVRGEALMLTPPSTAQVLRSGYPVQIDQRALRLVAAS